MEEFIMFSSEIVVALWFVPVILFIVIPLSWLCAWALHVLLGKVAEMIELAVRKVRVARRESRTPDFRPRAAV